MPDERPTNRNNVGRRRKEHLKSLEQAQKELSTERAEEIDRLRSLNNELRKEISALKAQIYGSSISNHQQLMSSTSVLDNRQYSLSPSVSGTSVSGTGSPPSAIVGSEFMSMGNLSISSSTMSPSMQAYTNHDLSSQPYSLVHYPGIRHNAHSSPESSGYRNSRTPVESSPFQPIKAEEQTTSSVVPVQGQASTMPALPLSTPYDRGRARAEISNLFRTLISDLSIENDPQRHFAVLRSMANSLPDSLKPTKLQLETAHYYGIDMIASPSLRDSLLSVNSEVARKFVDELGIVSADNETSNALTIWGNNPLNEMYWELSVEILERWGWVVGNDWIHQSNYWRRQRGLLLPTEW